LVAENQILGAQKMKLKKVVLTGYKSVKQEEILHVDTRVTILIGANDHGKSNLLAAITCLNDETPIAPEDRNWDLPERSTVELKWHFTASSDELEKLASIGPKQKVTENDQERSAREIERTEAPEASQPLQQESSAQGQSEPAPVNIDLPRSENGEVVFSRDSVTNKVKVIGVPVSVPVSGEQLVLALRPAVELFAPPSGNVIDQVNLEQLENAAQFEFMQGIFRLAGLWDHRKIIFTQNPTTSKILDQASDTLTETLRDQWNQGKELKWKFKHAGTNGDHILIELEDPAISGSYTRPSRRSAGFRSYFLLSMIIYARTKNKDANSYIYLFDEPGTYLHPSAQLDLQRSFEAIADDAQIVYTTHSLFLVSKNHPERNRVISKTKDGTKIDQRPYTRNWKAVRESLGILLSNNFLIAEKTLLVEGPSDIIYLLGAMKKLKSADQLDVDLNDLSIVDAGNSQNYLAMAKLMLSEGREIVALLDGDEAGKKIEAQLKKVCSAELKQKKLNVHALPKNKSSEDIFADLDALRAAANKAYGSLLGDQLRKPASNIKIAEVIQGIAPNGEKTLGRIMDEQTEACFDPPEKISKLLIATLYEDMVGGDHEKPAPEASLAELKKIKESLKLRGEKSERLGVFDEAE
jgi:predicted ATP-dependent endonuclease of OLD family